MSDSRQRPLAGVRVLVVENDEDGRELLRCVFENAGATVVAAATALEALELFALEPCDVLTSDIALPGADGWSLMREIRARAVGRTRALAAVAVCGYTVGGEAERSLRAGFDMHLSKPVPIDDLVERVVRLLRAGSAGGLAQRAIGGGPAPRRRHP